MFVVVLVRSVLLIFRMFTTIAVLVRRLLETFNINQIKTISVATTKLRTKHIHILWGIRYYHYKVTVLITITRLRFTVLANHVWTWWKIHLMISLLGESGLYLLYYCFYCARLLSVHQLKRCVMQDYFNWRTILHCWWNGNMLNSWTENTGGS